MKNDLIVSDPSVMMGKPVVAGTRITVELILEKLSAGESIEEPSRSPTRVTALTTNQRGTGRSAARSQAREGCSPCFDRLNVPYPAAAATKGKKFSCRDGGRIRQ